MTPVLRPYQIDLFNRIRAARSKGARIIVVQAATGSGKNSLAAHIARCAFDKGSAVLFLVHRRRLVEQISERLTQFDVRHGILMRGMTPAAGAAVQVASRDTLLSRCINNEWIEMPQADLVIVDEAHHAADPNSEYRRILHNYPRATLLLLSATPVGPGGGGLGPWAQAIECASPTSALVRDGWLVPVHCYAPDRQRKGKKYVRGIAGDLVDSWQRYSEGMATVLFCGRVQHSLDAVAAFNAAGIPAAHLDADTPDLDRDRIFSRMASGAIKVLGNVGIVGEGVDIPELGCCQLFMEVRSRVKFIQCVGRIMRPADGKTHGVLIDHAGAVFRHGFPDEDTTWTLEGNADADFAARHDAGDTEPTNYCAACSLVYHGSLSCPQCGRLPTKPPRSIFAPPPVEVRNELLVAADRGRPPEVSREEYVQHWFRCLAVAIKRKGTFAQARTIWKQKYGRWPPDDLPCSHSKWSDRVADVLPNFGKRRGAQS